MFVFCLSVRMPACLCGFLAAPASRHVFSIWVFQFFSAAHIKAKDVLYHNFYATFFYHASHISECSLACLYVFCWSVCISACQDERNSNVSAGSRVEQRPLQDKTPFSFQETLTANVLLLFYQILLLYYAFISAYNFHLHRRERTIPTQGSPPLGREENGLILELSLLSLTPTPPF